MKFEKVSQDCSFKEAIESCEGVMVDCCAALTVGALHQACSEFNCGLCDKPVKQNSHALSIIEYMKNNDNRLQLIYTIPLTVVAWICVGTAYITMLYVICFCRITGASLPTWVMRVVGSDDVHF